MSKIGRITLATEETPSFSHESKEKIIFNFFFESWKVPHSSFLKISSFRPVWTFFGPNLTFLGPFRPSEGVFNGISGLFGHFGCSNHLKKWFELSESSNLGQILAKKNRKNFKKFGGRKSLKKIFVHPEK